MKISTLICCHSTNNKNDLLLDNAITSILSQTRKPDEIIIVLDECWQGHDIYPSTKDFLKDWEYVDAFNELVKIFEKPKKEGLAAAKNFGLQYCTGDYITYCDADDYWHNTKLELQESFAKAHPEVDVIATESWDIRSNGGIYPNCFEIGQYRTNDEIRFRLQFENIICHASVMIKKDMLTKMNGYRNIHGAEDYDLWKRIAYVGGIFYKIPERLYYWRHGTSVAR